MSCNCDRKTLAGGVFIALCAFLYVGFQLSFTGYPTDYPPFALMDGQAQAQTRDDNLRFFASILEVEESGIFTKFAVHSTLNDGARLTALQVLDFLSKNTLSEHDLGVLSSHVEGDGDPSANVFDSVAAVFIYIIKQTESSAIFFECKPICYEDDLFEFVVVDASMEFDGVRPNKKAFSSHFTKSSPVISFHNLGKDAILVVPNKVENEDETSYTHLKTFSDHVGLQQQNELWKLVGHEALNGRRMSEDKPLWISTSGLGVYWLHVRLDSRPKYYTYTKYKKYEK